MGLVVRLRHALGERLVELTERTVERPLIVGRSKDADIKVPSVSVGSEHCALYVHERQWILHDMSGGATTVNGYSVVEPAPLCIGDVISLGADASPATIEVDPAGASAGKTGEPALELAKVAAPAVPKPRPSIARTAAAPLAGQYATTPASRLAPPPPPRQAPVLPTVDEWGQPVEEDAFASFGETTSVSASAASSQPRRRPVKKSSDTPMILGIGACLIIVGGTAYFAYNQSRKPVETSPVVVVAPPIIQSHKGNSIFDEGINSTPQPSAHQAAPPAPERVAVAPVEKAPPADSSDSDAGSSPKTGASSDEDAVKADPAWAEIDTAHYSPLYALSILKYDDYARQHAGMHQKELKAFTDEAVDRLWWKRIGQLLTKEKTLIKQIRKWDMDIKAETSATFKAQLKTEKKKFEDDLATATSTLNNDMGYKGDEIPDLSSDEQLTKLRAERDADKFGAWSQRIVKHIKLHHGTTPWDGED